MIKKQYQRGDIQPVVRRYQDKNKPEDRYASFDYCYHFFRRTSADELMADTEKSCLVVGFYLASWGMFRGRANLLQKSVKYSQPLIEYVAEVKDDVENIDVSFYDTESIDSNFADIM